MHIALYSFKTTTKQNIVTIYSIKYRKELRMIDLKKFKNKNKNNYDKRKDDKNERGKRS